MLNPGVATLPGIVQICIHTQASQSGPKLAGRQLRGLVDHLIDHAPRSVVWQVFGPAQQFLRTAQVEVAAQQSSMHIRQRRASSSAKCVSASADRRVRWSAPQPRSLPSQRPRDVALLAYHASQTRGPQCLDRQAPGVGHELWHALASD